MRFNSLKMAAALLAGVVAWGSLEAAAAPAKSQRRASKSPLASRSLRSRRTTAPASQRAVRQPQIVGRLAQVTRPESPIFAKPGTPPIYSRVKRGHFLILTGETEGWYSVLMADGRDGWIAKSRVKLLDYDVVSNPGEGASGSAGGASSSSFGNAVVQTAYRLQRIPYKWGGYSTDGTDCSGFVKAVFALNGVGLPRTSREQFKVGQTIPPEQMQPGDRVYFNMKGGPIDHTGIYIGGGYFIHSSISRGGIGVDALTGRYARAFCGAKR